MPKPEHLNLTPGNLCLTHGNTWGSHWFDFWELIQNIYQVLIRVSVSSPTWPDRAAPRTRSPGASCLISSRHNRRGWETPCTPDWSASRNPPQTTHSPPSKVCFSVLKVNLLTLKTPSLCVIGTVITELTWVLIESKIKFLNHIKPHFLLVVACHSQRELEIPSRVHRRENRWQTLKFVVQQKEISEL